MPKLLIYGTGTIADVAEFYLRTDSPNEVVAFTNAGEFITEDRFLERPVVPFEEVDRSFPAADYQLFVALGYKATNKIRQQRFEEALAKGYECVSYISSQAVVNAARIGRNCFIQEQNVVQPFVAIGDNVTLWAGNHIGHHSEIHDHAFISSHVVVSGHCVIEHNCFLGVNSTLRDNIRLGAFSVIGAGAVVMKDTEERSLVRPAESNCRVIKRDVI